MQKKFFAVVMSLVLLFPFLSPLNAKADDISGITLEKELRAMVEAGVIQGYGDGIYKPNEKVTRGEFATFIARALKLPEGAPTFPDVPSSSSLAYGVNAAAAAKIVNGYSDGKFNPQLSITRKDMALMISNALDYLKVDVTYNESSFSDITGLSTAHKNAINKSVTLKIISGYNEHTFGPNDQATRAHAAAFIYRMLQAVENLDGGGTPPPEPKPEPVKPYQVANIDSAGTLTYALTSYDSFEEAKRAMTSQGNELVTFNQKIIYMKENSGLVYAKPKSAATVNLYTDSLFKTAKTYVSSSATYGTTELKYVTSTDQYVQVNLGGEDYYMKPSDALLVPFEGAKGRSYYKNVNGELYHYLYNYDTTKYASYNAGVAPSFMSSNEKYYSFDNGNFYNEQGNKVGTAYQYFQFLSARTTSNYTAAELDNYILKVLAEKEATGSASYKEATKKSKLIGLGATLKKVEAEKRINALMILAMANHESNYGMSQHAQTNNNLFGIAVYDSTPDQGATFASPAESVYALADLFLNANTDWRGGYLVPNTWRSYGSAPGTKANGINVKYASDAWWGSKVGGHMYRIDKALGSKDFNKYQLGQTNTEGLNVRVTPNGDIQYQYKLKGMPVAYLGSTTASAGTTWQKIISDDLQYQEGYVSFRYLTTLPIAK
ncbi:S-layer homology domain-containing protein [Bacillus sp. FJAT-42315]|uniref:S-layer homology domain-containing protein n=1 Tax=Bacillus sp. FJAT-42315 TaxID=2014077 RepID=UPI0018E22571|nr:S-layer homology domain-containing protein [Bacillus sp. FJAT-42315]